MPSNVNLEVNVPEVVHSLETFKSKQLPFAASLGLNLTLKDAQAQVRKELPRRFTLRRPWVARGVQVKPSTKNRLWGWVSQRDIFMALHEPGGLKKPAGRMLAIPIGKLQRRAKRQVLPKSQRPAGQLRKKNVYIGQTQKGVPAIIKRGTGRARQQVLYILKPSARIEPQFNFVPTVTRVVRRRWQRNFGAAMARAVRTSR